ncbi:MAG: hypothetical protein HOD58_06655 [Gammaproteobacteria bacterium]|jgi:hypothetical protein|nr:hypothetical protein [Gammaproteobacteria bacterium]
MSHEIVAMDAENIENMDLPDEIKEHARTYLAISEKIFKHEHDEVFGILVGLITNFTLAMSKSADTTPQRVVQSISDTVMETIFEVEDKRKKG